MAFFPLRWKNADRYQLIDSSESYFDEEASPAIFASVPMWDAELVKISRLCGKGFCEYDLNLERGPRKQVDCRHLLPEWVSWL